MSQDGGFITALVSSLKHGDEVARVWRWMSTSAARTWVI